MPVSEKRRQRKFYGRTRNACTSCRSNRTKCDGGSPCATCEKYSRKCSNGYTPDSPGTSSEEEENLSIIPNPADIRGGQPIRNFAGWFAATAGSGPCWDQGVLPAAQEHVSVLNAIDAYTTIIQLPLDQAVSGLYLPEQAIRSYSESVASREADIKLTLMTACIYASIESRLGNIENMNSISRSVFALFVAYQQTIETEYRRDAVMYGILEATVLSIPNSHADTRCVPAEHWPVAIGLYVKLATERGILTPQRVFELEWARIAFDVNRGYSAPEFDGSDIANRIVSLKRNLNKHRLSCLKEGKQVNLKYVEREIWATEMAWHFRQWREHGDRLDFDIWQLTSQALLKDIEVFPDISKRYGFYEYWIDSHIIQTVVSLAYYDRSANTARRLKDIVNKYDQRVSYANKVINYIETMVGTEYDQPSVFEMELFGPDPPKVLRHCQLTWITNHLARPPRPPADPVASASA